MKEVSNKDLECDFFKELSDNEKETANTLSLMPSDNDIEWLPIIGIYDKEKLIGYLYLNITFTSNHSEEGSLSISVANHVKYMFMSPEYRGKGIYSLFTSTLYPDLLQEISYIVENLNCEPEDLIYIADYASAEGRYIGNKISESLEVHAENNGFSYCEDV